MKKLWIILIVLAGLLPIGARSVIVNNSGSTGADSISFPFYALDSAGNVVATASGDSVFIRVWYPSGALAFEDSLAYNGTKITTETQHGISTYTWKEAVAAIDGTPRDGVYAWEILVHDLTSAALWTPHSGQFQLYQAYDYNTWATFQIDSLQAALDSAQAIMAKLIVVQDTTQGSKDLLDAGLSVTVATNNDKTGYSLTTAERAAIEDSIHAHAADYKATAFATAAELTKAIDSINAILDTLQLFDGWVAQEASLDWGKVWYDVDSTNVDSSDIGDWMTNNLSGAAGGLDTLTTAFVDRLMGRMADSIWKSILADYDGVAGSFGDSAQGWGATSAGGLDSSIVQRIGNRLTRDTTNTVHGSGSYETATGFSTHSAANVWSVGTRDLTDKAGFSLTTAERAAIEDSVHAQAADYKATGFSTHNPAGVYTQFTSGANEDAFKATGFALAGDAMALTPAERGHIEDSVHAQAADYKATAFATASELTKAIDSINAILDTLQLFDGRVALEPDHWSAADSTAYQGSASGLTAAEIADSLRTEHGTGSWQSGASGSGTYAVYLRFIDSSGTDDTLSNISATIQNQSGVVQAGPLTSGSNGLAGNYNVNDSVIFVASGGAAYTFELAGATIAANDTINVYGYNNVVASPSNADYATAYGYEYDVTGSAVQNIIISLKRLTIVGAPGIDSVNNIALTDVLIKDTTDASGYWSIDVLRTGQYADTAVGFYFFEAYQDNRRLWSADTVYVGDTGNLNMVDYLAGWRY